MKAERSRLRLWTSLDKSSWVNIEVNSVILHVTVFNILTFWRRNYFLNFSTPCI